MQQIIYRCKRIYHFFKTGLFNGFFAAIRYRHPEKKLKIIAITGTDGKTTTASLVYSLLKNANYKVGLISTVAAYIGNQKIDTGFHVTSPSPRDLYRFMAQMVDQNIEYLVLEITSQGVYQWRNWGIKPIISGLTNIDREHLDYHLTYENYLQAKMLILQSSPVAVINEDQSGYTIIKKTLGHKTKIINYSKKSRFSAELEKAIRHQLKENYNRLNAHLAITIAKFLGCSDKQLVRGIENFSLPQGRMELVPNDLNCIMIVDFAHTPQALKAALVNIKKNYVKKEAKFIGLVGCAGLRDKSKRPAMGKILAENCDLAIFTAEDPRTENIWSIIRQMKEDIAPHHRRIISIPNREKALSYVLTHYGKNGNTIAIFGKGHEQSMCYDGYHEQPWNDIVGAKKIIKKLQSC